MPTFGTTTWGTDLVKTDKYYIGKIYQWITDLFGYSLENGRDDFVYNNCRMIMQTEDKSQWAYNLFARCSDLLLWHHRWPQNIQDKIPEDRQCKTRLCSLFYKMKYKSLKGLGVYDWLDGKDSKLSKLVYKWSRCKSRSWGDMTRDPYIAFYTCAVYLNLPDFIQAASMPWYLYRRNVWAWHRYLQEPGWWNWDKYDITHDHQTKHKKEFVNVLREMRVWAALEINYKTQ